MSHPAGWLGCRVGLAWFVTRCLCVYCVPCKAIRDMALMWCWGMRSGAGWVLGGFLLVSLVPFFVFVILIILLFFLLFLFSSLSFFFVHFIFFFTSRENSQASCVAADNMSLRLNLSSGCRRHT